MYTLTNNLAYKELNVQKDMKHKFRPIEKYAEN